jgi:hypothetical protein
MEENGNLVMGTFNCVGFQKGEWEPILLQMIETLMGKGNYTHAAGGGISRQ